MGVIFHLGEEKRLDELSSFDIKVLALGANKENKAGLEEKDDVRLGIKMLKEIENGNIEEIKKHKIAYVWGGGNVAFDAARSLKRLLPEVHILYRRDIEQMPANKDEILEAKKEGIIFNTLENLVKPIFDENDKLVSIETIKMRLGEKDESGRESFIEIEGSNQIREVDYFVIAIGSKSELDIKEKEGHYVASIDAYVIGDFHLGPSNVAKCIEDGKQAYLEIKERLSSK